MNRHPARTGGKWAERSQPQVNDEQPSKYLVSSLHSAWESGISVLGTLLRLHNHQPSRVGG